MAKLNHLLKVFLALTIRHCFHFVLRLARESFGVCLSLVFYSTCKKKSKLLLLLLTIWGLTGIKSLLFDAYEDIILLICGIYGSWILYKECKNKY